MGSLRGTEGVKSAGETGAGSGLVERRCQWEVDEDPEVGGLGVKLKK